MKYLLLIALILMPTTAFAKGGGGGKHFKKNPPYDCSVTKKPGKIDWIVKAKSDKVGDGVVELTWDDSDRAHKVEVKYGYNGKFKTEETHDDSREKMRGLKKGVVYEFKMRGISNCGKSAWSKTYRALP